MEEFDESWLPDHTIWGNLAIWKTLRLLRCCSSSLGTIGSGSSIMHGLASLCLTDLIGSRDFFPSINDHGLLLNLIGREFSIWFHVLSETFMVPPFELSIRHLNQSIIGCTILLLFLIIGSTRWVRLSLPLFPVAHGHHNRFSLFVDISFYLLRLLFNTEYNME